MMMIRKVVSVKLVVVLSFLGGVLVAAHLSAAPQRSKKQNMIEMGQQFDALQRKMTAGAVSTKFTDQDFQDMTAACDALTRLANEYSQMESNQDLAAVSKRMAGTVGYLKQQIDGKDPLITVMSYGQVMSYCAECHYQSRWGAPPAK
jgi:hypothetical protein